jgi:hypothetical protein
MSAQKRPRTAAILLLAVTLLAVACSSQADLGDGAQPIGGQLAGLTPGESITLQNNSGDNLTLSSNGPFTFATPVAGDRAYSVTILTSPSSPIHQACTLSNETGTVTAAPVTNVTVNCDLLAYFPFSGNANDESGYGHDGVVSGATLTTGANGNGSAYAFNGNASIQASMPVGFLPNNDEPRTLTAWLMPTQSNTAWDVVFWGTGNCTGKQFGLGDVSDNAAFWSGCNDFQSTLSIPPNVWTFVAIVYSPEFPTWVTLYVDNLAGTASIATGSIMGLRTPGSGDLVMGGAIQAGTPMYFTGSIDSVRVYGHALGPDEVGSLASAMDP